MKKPSNKLINIKYCSATAYFFSDFLIYIWLGNFKMG